MTERKREGGREREREKEIEREKKREKERERERERKREKEKDNVLILYYSHETIQNNFPSTNNISYHIIKQYYYYC